MGIGFEMGSDVKGRERLVECLVCLGRDVGAADSWIGASLESEVRAGKVNSETLLLSLSTVLGCDVGAGLASKAFGGATVRGDTGLLGRKGS